MKKKNIKNKDKYTSHVVEFVFGSDLFKELPELFESLSTSSQITWGNANFTLVTPNRILNELELIEDADLEQLGELRKRISELPDSVYVDLEN